LTTTMDEALQSHPSDEALDGFLRRTATAAELVEMDGHLAACAQCRDRLRLRSGASDAAALRERDLAAAIPPAHLPDDAVRAAAEGGEDDETRRHLARCAACRAEVADLRRFIAGRRGARWERSWIWAAAAVVVTAVGLTIWWQRHFAPVLSASLHDSGGTIGVDAWGGLHSSKAVPAAYTGLLANTLRSGRLEVAGPAARFHRQPDLLLGLAQGGAAVVLRSPVGEASVSDRPQFEWLPLNGAASYQVSVFDDDFRKVAQSPPLRTTLWEADPPLARGRTYTWVVDATAGGKTVRAPLPPAPEARFAVVSAEDAAALAQVRNFFPDGHLLLAALLARAGAITEARREVDALAADNPGSELVARLRASLAQ